MTAHARLSASTSERWINCPGSVALSDKIPSQSSGAAAREGTSAHALAEQILRYAIDKKEGERGLRQRYKEGTTIRYEDHGEKCMMNVTQEMLDHVMVYVNRMLSYGAKNLHVELQLSLEKLVRDNMFGTSDCVADVHNTLVVSDFKYGYTPVLLVDEHGNPNSQLMYYAAGALDHFKWKHERVVLDVVQPRCTEVEPIQSITLRAETVREWARTTLYDAAHATDDPNARLSPGAHCRWCPAIHICPAMLMEANTLAATDFADNARVPIIPNDPAQLSRILHAAPHIDAWLRGCEESARQLLTAGTPVPGYKLVKKKANREWPTENATELANLLNAHLPNEKQLRSIERLLTKPELLGPAQIDKVVGKEIVNKVAIKPDNGVTVARDSDTRPAVTVKCTDFADDIGDLL